MLERITQPDAGTETELDLFVQWGNNLSASDPVFAETLIMGIVEAEFPDASYMDKTE